MRYACLCTTMVFRLLSPRVRKRFPKLEDLIEAGLLNDDELHILLEMERKFPGYPMYYMPICWAANLAAKVNFLKYTFNLNHQLILIFKARVDGRIKDDFALRTIIQTLNNMRSSAADLQAYAFVCESLSIN